MAQYYSLYQVINFEDGDARLKYIEDFHLTQAQTRSRSLICLPRSGSQPNATFLEDAG